MDKHKLAEGELKFMQIIWENNTISGARLVKECEKRLNWKKSTTYTVLKRLSEKGVVENNSSLITPLIAQKDIEIYESNAVVNRAFGGSLPGFVAAFMDGKKLSKSDAERLRELIDKFEE